MKFVPAQPGQFVVIAFPNMMFDVEDVDGRSTQIDPYLILEMPRDQFSKSEINLR